MTRPFTISLLSSLVDDRHAERRAFGGVRALGMLLFVSLQTTGTLVGCTGECQYYNDCPAGEVCTTEKTCVSNGVTGGGGIIPPPPPRDGGTGGGTIDTRVQTLFKIPWLARDPRDPNRGIFPFYEENGAIDELRSFDLATGAIRDPEDIDFVTLTNLDDGSPGAPCRADNLYPEPNIPSQHNKPETWLICQRGAGIRIHYDNNFAQPGMPVELASEAGYVMMSLDVTGIGTNDFDRRLTFERGGNALHIYQLNPNQDGEFNERIKDTVDVNVTLEGITQVWQLAPVATVGDVIVVFARGGATPSLIPLVRLVDTTTWVHAQPFTGLDTLKLPAKTHAVVRIGEIQPQGLSPQGIPNVMTIEPETGYLRFFVQSNLPPDPVQPELFFTIYEPNLSFTGQAPDADERLLLEPAPGGVNATFYMHPRIGRVWRLPHQPNSEDDIYTYTILGGATLATGLIPTGALTTWISVPATQELLKVTLSQDN